MPICEICYRINGQESSQIHHQASFPELQISAEDCPICALLLDIVGSDTELLDSLAKEVNNPNGYTKMRIFQGPKPNPTHEGRSDVGLPMKQIVFITRANYLYGPHFVLNYEGGKYSDRAIWRSKVPVTFDDTMPVIEDWISECKSQHRLCFSEAKPLPSRILFIDSSSIGGQIRLIQPDKQSGLYAALSHCWGSPSDVLCTTKSTLVAHLRSVDICKLAPNFRDAVEITRKLGLHYLWIDSLCIIQDDESDWQQESSNMASVFNNAFITIAATAASDSSGGLLFPRQPARHIPSSDSVETSHTTYMRLPGTESESLYKSPLYRRGWVLQEMVLSNRVLHFARDQLFWHCRGRITSEDGAFDSILGSTFFDLSSKAAAQKSWWTWIEDYSSRALTRQSDKFAALGGLTRSFQSVGKSEPMAGLWKDDLHFGLLWCARNKSSRSSMAGIPSWSWASIEGPIRSVSPRGSVKWNDHNEGVKKEANFGNFQLSWSGDSLVSTIISGTLELSARIRTAFVAAEANQQHLFNEANRWTGRSHYANFHKFATLYRLLPLTTPFDNPKSLCRGHCCFDLQAPESGSVIYCLQISVTYHSSYLQHEFSSAQSSNFHDLILVEATGNRPDEFRRIGLGMIEAFEDDTDYFFDVDKTDLYLV